MDQQSSRPGREVTAIDRLYEEHRQVTAALDELDGLLARAGGSAAPEDWTGIIADIRRLADELDRELTTHLALEEERLFPAMERYIGREGGPIAVMLMEHEGMRRAVQRLRDAAGRASSSPEPVAEILDAGGELISLLSEHIHKEDHVLFPMALRMLAPKEVEQLLDGWAV